MYDRQYYVLRGLMPPAFMHYECLLEGQGLGRGRISLCMCICVTRVLTSHVFALFFLLYFYGLLLSLLLHKN